MDSDRFQEKQQRPRLGFEKDSTTIRVGKYIKIKFGKGEVAVHIATLNIKQAALSLSFKFRLYCHEKN